MANLTWLLETATFPTSHKQMSEAVIKAGFAVENWNDEWWKNRRWPVVERAIFHGSLGNAARIRKELPWQPGSYCATEAFYCTAWYPRAKEWLFHTRWVSTSVESLVSNVPAVLKELDSPERVFVRPDSPLKPFSGRVLSSHTISLKALDHGFYYEDTKLPILVAPVQSVGKEYRYVVVEGRIVAGSAYEASGRAARADDPHGEPWAFASSIAQKLLAPEPVYVMDLCESDRGLRLLELNPFSGADLYACNREDVVVAVSAHVLKNKT